MNEPGVLRSTHGGGSLTEPTLPPIRSGARRADHVPARSRHHREGVLGTPGTPLETPPRATATLAVTSAATAVALMTYTAPMVTLPGTAAALHTPVSAQAWLLNGTPLGLAALLLVAGSLADDYGRRRIFLSGTIALGITTALGALATSTWLFTLARVAQGAASAAILASSLGLLVHAFPTARGRLHATSVWGAFVSGGIALGPLLAYAIAQTLNWRIAYAVLGAAALLVALLGTRALTESRASRGGRPDLVSAFTFGLALVALVAALTLGRDGWLRPSVGLLLTAFVVLTTAFVFVEHRTRTPMIDLSLLRHRRFLASSASGLFTGLAVIGLFSFLAGAAPADPGPVRAGHGVAVPALVRAVLRGRPAGAAPRGPGLPAPPTRPRIRAARGRRPDDAGRARRRFMDPSAARLPRLRRRQRAPQRRAAARRGRVRPREPRRDGLGRAADVPLHRLVRRLRP